MRAECPGQESLVNNGFIQFSNSITEHNERVIALSTLTTIRQLSSMATSHFAEGGSELDSHADTCVVGEHAFILYDHNQPVRVTGYDKGKVSKPYSTVTAALGYTDEYTGDVSILIIHQAIHIPQMKHNLLCPMQMRLNDVEVNDVPKFMVNRPTEKTHAIVASDGAGEVIIPLKLKGVTSYFNSWKPTQADVDNHTTFDLTYESPEWDPTASQYADQEEAMLDFRGDVIDTGVRHKPLTLCVN